ncbi:MAG: hypothetical protein ABIH26_11740, partial [Candidatus Eisenbacteria bacterium]
VLLDSNNQMQRLYRFSKIPQLFLIAPDGTIAFSKLGFAPGQEKKLAEEVEKVLAAKPGAKASAETDESRQSENPDATAAGEEE